VESVFEVDDARGIGRWALKGQVTDDGFRESFRSVNEVLAGLSLTAGIIDFSEVTSFDVSEETIRQLASTQPVLSGEMLRLVIAPQGEAFAKARSFASVSQLSRPNLFVVKSAEAAYHILGLQNPAFRRLAG